MKMFFVLFTISAIFLNCTFVSVLSAQSVASAPVLQLIPDPRVSSMGMGGVAYSDARSAGFYFNPAHFGANAFRTTERGDFFNTADLNYSRINPAMGFDMWMGSVYGTWTPQNMAYPISIGYGFQYLDLGESDILNEAGDELGTWRQYEMIFHTTAGIKFNEYWSFGLGAKYLYSELFSKKVSDTRGDEFRGVGPSDAFAFDVGLIGVFDEGRYAVGASVMNMYFGKGLSYQKGVHDALPVTAHIGGIMPIFESENTMTRMHYDVSLLLLKPHTKKPLRYTGHSIGFETLYGEERVFSTRIGLYTETEAAGGRTRLTFGMGFTINERMDFSAGYYVGGFTKTEMTANPLQLSIGVRY